MQLWDTPGSQQFDEVNKIFYKGSIAAILVYDVTDTNALEESKRILNNFKEVVTKDYFICLVANKIDMVDQIEITTQQGE